MEAHDCNFHDELRFCINARCPLHRAMRTLAANLSQAAIGCAGFSEGMTYAMAGALGIPEGRMWTPGCQRPAPGYVEKLEVGR